MTGASVSEAIGVVLERTGNYSAIFACASLLYVVALAFIHLFVPRIGGVPGSPKEA